jgi:SAM-dependent methyltransferase
MRPRKYVGVDMATGKGVDEVCLAENLVKRFGPRSWDIVVCTEMLEHVKEWSVAVSNLKQVVKENGLLVLTTRSPGFPRHGHPDDYWRFTSDHIKAIFSDMDIKVIAIDFEAPGIFVKAFKRRAFTEVDYSKISPEPAPK